jgi:predicted ATP-grasp superfamily ATP-dependent carboligase
LTQTDRAPSTADPTWSAAIVLGAYQTGVVAVRSLRRRGVRVELVDCDARQPGFRSRHGPALLCPDPDAEPDHWLSFMRDLGRRLGDRPALLASSDQFVSAIARFATELREGFRLCDGAELQGALANKDTQYDLAAQHGMPMPLTRFAGSADAVAGFASTAMFPCVLKPLHFREWQRFPFGHRLAHQKLVIAHDAAELRECHALAAQANPNVILQEIIQGPDTNKRVYLAHYRADGARTGHALFRELRCDPIGFGPATVTEPVADAEAESICDDFLRAINYRGICEIEVKRDVRDGHVKLIEANPRLSGGGDAAPYDGVDLGWLHYLDLNGVRHEPVQPLRRDFRHVAVRNDAFAVVRYLRAGLIGWRDVLRSYRPPVAFFDLDRRDAARSLRTLASVVRTVLRESTARRDPALKAAARDAGLTPRAP